MQSAFNVHQLYQDLYISDMKGEIDTVNCESLNLRQQLIELQSKVQYLEKENGALKQKIGIYRNKAAQNITPEYRGEELSQATLSCASPVSQAHGPPEVLNSV